MRNGQLPWRWSLLTTPFPKPYGPRSVGVRPEGPRPVWVCLLSGWGVSNLYQPPRKTISPFLGPAPDLLLEDPVAGGPPPPWAPRRGTRSPDIDSGLVRGVSVRVRVRSGILPTGHLEGWYPANTARYLSKTRKSRAVGVTGLPRWLPIEIMVVWWYAGTNASPLITFDKLLKLWWYGGMLVRTLLTGY